MSDKSAQLAYLANAIAQNLHSRTAHGHVGNFDSKHLQAWCDYGFKETLVFNDHYQMYRRFGIANAGIKIPVEQCWKSLPRIAEGTEEESDSRDFETVWEEEVNQVFKKTKLWYELKQVDEYQRIGHYAAFVVQVRSSSKKVVDYNNPLGMIRADQIVKFIPVTEGQLIPTEWEQDRVSPRYGEPVRYTLRESALIDDTRQDQRTQDVQVHHSRVIVFAEGASTDSIYGVPANEAGFNALITLNKIVGAGGEGLWKNAAMKTVYTNDNKDAPMPSVEELDGMDEAVSDFVEGLDKYLMTGNMSPNVLGTSMAGLKESFEIALNDYASSMGIATKVLIGSQSGRLAADEDGRFTLSNFQSRRETWCTQMVTATLDWMISHGAIDAIEFSIIWDDLLAPSDKDKMEIVEKMAKINQTAMETVFTAEEMRVVGGYSPAPEELNEEADPIGEKGFEQDDYQ